MRESLVDDTSQEELLPSHYQQHRCLSATHELCSFGFTGETYYDYDKGLDVDHPIVILHFNDVYNIEPQSNGRGGISRFVSAIRHFADSNPLILFSGDAFNPSFISTFTRGRHMVSFLNMLKVHTACIGNHDLDFGIDHLEYLTGSTSFPWLLSNVFDAYTPDKPLGSASRYRLFEWQGHRVGIFGLVEEEWLATLSEINLSDVVYKDYVEAANELSDLLRSKECELIIALTHMRAPNDARLAMEAKDIDLILGGHDHDYFGATRIGNAIVCKSGTDFRELTALTIYPGAKTSPRFMSSNGESEEPDILPALGLKNVGHFEPQTATTGAFLMPRFKGGSVIEWDKVDVTPEAFSTNRHVDRLVAKYIADLERHMQKPLGESGVFLETRFSIIRTQETNAGNWLTDLMRMNTKADIAFVNAGTLRSDCVFEPGTLLIKDLVSMLPMPDELMVIEMTKKDLIATLEAAVSQYPKTEGRFLQVSGFCFSFDPRKPPGSRVVKVELRTLDEHGAPQQRPISDDEILTACTKKYLADGHDGFGCLVDLKVRLTGEEAPNLPTMVRNCFTLAAMVSGLRKPRNTATLVRVDTFRAMPETEQQHLCGLTVDEDGRCKLSCKVEDRITVVTTPDDL